MLFSRYGLVPVVLLSVPAAAPAEERLDLGKVHLVRTMDEPDDRIQMLSFSADGGRLVSSGGRSIRLWDPATGKELGRFGHKNELAGWVFLAPDGRTVATSFGVHTEILLVDVISGKILQRLTHPEPVVGYALSPDGKALISSAYDRILRLWDVTTGKELRHWRVRDPGTGKELGPSKSRDSHDFEDLSPPVFSPDGKTVAVGIRDGSIRLCDVATGAETRRLFHKDDDKLHVGPLAFSPDGRFLVVGGVHLWVTARMWDVTTGKAVREFRLPPSALPPLPPGTVEPGAEPPPQRQGSYAAAFTPDGKTLATSRFLGICLWEVATGSPRHRFGDPSIGETVLKFTPNGRLLAGSSLNKGRGHIHLWDWRDPCLQQPRRLESKEIERLWADLALEDAVKGYQAIATLRVVAEQAVEMLAQRLQPIEPVNGSQLDRLVAQLDDDRSAVRDEASEKLAALAELARPVLKRALAGKPSEEAKRRIERLMAQLDGPITSTRLRCLRAVEVLECIGSAEAQRVLQKLADGAPGAVETEDARAALKRLSRK